MTSFYNKLLIRKIVIHIYHSSNSSGNKNNNKNYNKKTITVAAIN